MGVTPESLRLAVDHCVATINGRDPVAIGKLFTQDALQADPASGPPSIGREAITEFFATGIGASDDWVFEAVDVHTCASSVAIDFVISVAMAGGTMRVAGIEVFEADDDGRFSSARAYWDDTDVTFA